MYSLGGWAGFTLATVDGAGGVADLSRTGAEGRPLGALGARPKPAPSALSALTSRAQPSTRSFPIDRRPEGPFHCPASSNPMVSHAEQPTHHVSPARGLQLLHLRQGSPIPRHSGYKPKWHHAKLSSCKQSRRLTYIVYQIRLHHILSYFQEIFNRTFWTDPLDWVRARAAKGPKFDTFTARADPFLSFKARGVCSKFLRYGNGRVLVQKLVQTSTSKQKPTSCIVHSGQWRYRMVVARIPIIQEIFNSTFWTDPSRPKLKGSVQKGPVQNVLEYYIISYRIVSYVSSDIILYCIIWHHIIS